MTIEGVCRGDFWALMILRENLIDLLKKRKKKVYELRNKGKNGGLLLALWLARKESKEQRWKLCIVGEF